MKAALNKATWVGRATVLLVGLAVILALTFGVASQALAGKKGSASGPKLIDVQSDGTGFNDKVATSSRLRTGVYLVEFKQAVDGCHRLASLGSTRGNFFNPDLSTPDIIGEVRTTGASPGGFDDTDRKRILVTTYDSAGNLRRPHGM